MDPDDVEAVEEVDSERSLLHHLLQVLVGRGDDPDVDLHRLVAAHAVELPVGEHAEEPRLHVGRHVADFIKEKRAAVSLLEPSGVRGARSGERSLLVSEELRLDELLGYRRHVEGDERPVGSGGVAVEGVRDQLLAGAGLSGDEHRDRGSREASYRAEHLLHRGGLAHDLLGDVDAAAAFLAPAALLPPLEDKALGLLHEADRLVDVEGLRQVLECSALVGVDRVREVGVGRRDDDRNVAVVGMDPLQQLEPVDSRHPDVGNHYVGRSSLETLQNILAILKTGAVKPLGAQRFLKHPAD